MASVDVDSLFKNNLRGKTKDISIDNLCNGNKNPPYIYKYDCCHLLNIATKESFFTFNNKYYKQLDGAAMDLYRV